MDNLSILKCPDRVDLFSRGMQYEHGQQHDMEEVLSQILSRIDLETTDPEVRRKYSSSDGHSATTKCKSCGIPDERARTTRANNSFHWSGHAL